MNNKTILPLIMDFREKYFYTKLAAMATSRILSNKIANNRNRHPLSRSVHGCINLIFIILSILFNLFICINLVYFFVFLFNYFIYLNFTYSECNASKGLSHN